MCDCSAILDDIFGTTMPTPMTVPAYDVVSKTMSSVPTSEDVKYSCVFENQWSAARHPIMYPSNAHWSPPVILGHSDAYSMFAGGAMASLGVENIAETGETAQLVGTEIPNAGAAAGMPAVGMGQFNNMVQNQTLPAFSVSMSTPYISSISMIAPSPDWFSGFNSFMAAKDGMWYESFTIDTYPWDAGTEQGNTFDINGDMVEMNNVVRISKDTAPANDNGVFLDSTMSTVLPVARYTCSIKPEPAAYDVVAKTMSTVPMSEDIKYSCMFENQWSGIRHPIMYPDDAHWSPPVILGHSSAYTLFAEGAMATLGVENVAETGNSMQLVDVEIPAAGAAAGMPAVGMGQFNNVKQSQTLPAFSVSLSTPYISSISMIAPSPDWFSGFNSFMAGKDGMWYESFTIDTYPWDAGTEMGNTFNVSGDIVEMNNVMRISEHTAPATDNGVFLDSSMTTVLPVARYTCSIKPEPAAYDLVESTMSSVAMTESAVYSCLFINQWSGARHPIMYPDDAHWSPPVLVGHSNAYTMFASGTMATYGLEKVAEAGDATNLTETEIPAAGSATGTPVVGMGQFNNVVQNQTLPDLFLDPTTPYISSVTMIAPSPDWFSGFNSFMAGKSGMWYESFTIDTYPWDAGTEVGNTFNVSGDVVEMNYVVRISEHTAPATDNGVFLDSSMVTVLPVARYMCSLSMN